MATQPTHIYSSTLHRRDRRWRARHRRVFVVGSVTRFGAALSVAGLALAVAAERVLGG